MQQILPKLSQDKINFEQTIKPQKTTVARGNNLQLLNGFFSKPLPHFSELASARVK